MVQLFKGRLLQIILLIGIAAGATSLLFLNLQDTVVHTTLYNYGLQFSLDWASRYWTYLRTAIICIGISLVSSVIGLFYVRRQLSLYTPLEFRPERKIRLGLTKIVSSALLFTGIMAFLISMLVSSPILAFIGLGLAFWGVLFLYIRKEEYIQEALLEKTTSSSLMTINQMIMKLGFKGKASYLPPKYLKNPESSKVLIAKNEETRLITPQKAQEEDTIFVTKPDSILITPPGAGLADLFERTLNMNFIKVDLNYLVQNLPNLLIKDLEIAESVKIQLKDNRINLEIYNSIYTHLHRETEEHQNVLGPLGCPICSAIACSITKVTGKLVTIENHQTSFDGNTIKTEYLLHNE